MTLLASLVLLAGASEVPTPAPSVLRPPVVRQVATAVTVPVVVLTSGDPAPVLAGLPPREFEVRRRYQRLAAFAGVATAEGLRRLAEDPRVTAVQLDETGHSLTAESGAVIGSTQVHQQLGLTGLGVTVAVLDTGVDAQHPDLDAGVVAQRCFVHAGCPPGNTDTGELAPEGDGHGTHVTGIITGDGVVAPVGIAPGARVVAVRVFDDQAMGTESDWAAALDWLLVHPELGVRLVNMSLGTDHDYPGACDHDQPLLSDAIGQLRDAGVLVFVAAGNEGQADAMSAPACIAAAVAVGATYDADLGREPDTGTYTCGCADEATDAGSVVCFSNGSDQLDLLAPGSRIRSAAAGGGSVEKRGTSQAAPHATAVAALMLELDPALSADELERLLKQTGVPTLDPKNRRTTPRLDALAAVRAVQATFCTRRADGAACRLELPCDGGACAGGTCAAGQCAVVVPAFTPLPAASGCSAGVGSALVGGALLVLATAWRRRRGRH